MSEGVPCKTTAGPTLQGAPKLPPSPPGLSAIFSATQRLYPDQPNPLQVRALRKYWLGGPDPLDYVTMYGNKGDATRGITPHWHYISCGFSDLYGDGRVHSVTGDDSPSGFGFEMTFRLKRCGEESPPTWPAELMQSLARYLFNSDNNFQTGDHISWHTPLDNKNKFIEHMLLADDPQMQVLSTPFGRVSFIQIVGVCLEELHAAQSWNSIGVLDFLRTDNSIAGPWLVTDMRRSCSVFDRKPSLRNTVLLCVDQEGSSVSGVSARCTWSATTVAQLASVSALIPRSSANCQSGPRSWTPLRRHSSSTLDDIHIRDGFSPVSELLPANSLEAVSVHLDVESASLLPLVLRGRLRHGRHFTFKSSGSNVGITFLSPDIRGSHVTPDQPYACVGYWLQVLFPDEFIAVLIEELDELTRPDELVLPRQFVWPSRGLMLVVVEDVMFKEEPKSADRSPPYLKTPS